MSTQNLPGTRQSLMSKIKQRRDFLSGSSHRKTATLIGGRDIASDLSNSVWYGTNPTLRNYAIVVSTLLRGRKWAFLD